MTEVPTLNIANGAILNYTGESVATPAIYKDEKTAEVSVKYDGIKAAANVNDGSVRSTSTSMLLMLLSIKRVILC